MADTNLTNAGLLALALTVALKWAGVFSKIADLLNGEKAKSGNNGVDNGRSGQQSVAEWEQRIERIVDAKLNAKLGPIASVTADTSEKVNRLLAYAEMEQRRQRRQ